MGQLLLDGRNPQSYKDTLQRFEQLTQIGRISLECWHLMITTLWEGLAFNQEDDFIEHTAKEWAERSLPTT